MVYYPWLRAPVQYRSSTPLSSGDDQICPRRVGPSTARPRARSMLRCRSACGRPAKMSLLGLGCGRRALGGSSFHTLSTMFARRVCALR